jgi:hypothetical protein
MAGFDGLFGIPITIVLSSVSNGWKARANLQFNDSQEAQDNETASVAILVASR